MRVNNLPLASSDARELRHDGTVHRVRTRVGHEAWLVTGYEEVRALIDDPRLGRSHREPDTAARTGDSALFGGPMGDFETEHADHARMRAQLQPHFSPKRMRALRPRVEELAEGLLDDLAADGPPADLQAAVATPLPILVICELLGVPYEDREQFRAWTAAAGNTLDNERSLRGLADLYAYGQRLVARKRAEPGDDVISRLLQTPDMDDDLVARRAMALLFAGHETTVVRIGIGALHLLANRDQWELLRENPDLIPGAIDEIMRSPGESTGEGLPRYAREDFELAGVQIGAGELVLLDLQAANVDEKEWRDPGRFDVTRQAVGHLSFGHGARYCIGAPLAKIELAAVYTRLIPRFPELRLAVPAAELRYHTGTLTGGLVELPVTW
ncbi:MAG: cytochrome P450 [Nonomuraea sp.]|nr:cytochrome P450 [Nonomuraea sp.]